MRVVGTITIIVVMYSLLYGPNDQIGVRLLEWAAILGAGMICFGLSRLVAFYVPPRTVTRFAVWAAAVTIIGALGIVAILLARGIP